MIDIFSIMKSKKLKLPKESHNIFHQKSTSLQQEYALVDLTVKREVAVEQLSKLIFDVNNKFRENDDDCILETFILFNKLRNCTFDLIEGVLKWQQGFTQSIRPQLCEIDYLVKMIDKIEFVSSTALRRLYNFQFRLGNIFLLPFINPRKIEPHIINKRLARQVVNFAFPSEERLVKNYQILINSLPPAVFKKILPLDSWLENKWQPQVYLKPDTPPAQVIESNIENNPGHENNNTSMEAQNQAKAATNRRASNVMSPAMNRRASNVMSPAMNRRASNVMSPATDRRASNVMSPATNRRASNAMSPATNRLVKDTNDTKSEQLNTTSNSATVTSTLIDSVLVEKALSKKTIKDEELNIFEAKCKSFSKHITLFANNFYDLNDTLESNTLTSATIHSTASNRPKSKENPHSKGSDRSNINTPLESKDLLDVFDKMNINDFVPNTYVKQDLTSKTRVVKEDWNSFSIEEKAMKMSIKTNKLAALGRAFAANSVTI